MKKVLTVFVVIFIMAGFEGCQAVKRALKKPVSQEVIESSYPTMIYSYDTTLTVKATPQELIDYFIKDFSHYEEIGGMLQLKFKDLEPGLDLTQVGQSVYFDANILGIDFPCEMINLKYVPEKELWLMVITGNNWSIARFELKPVKQGSVVDLKVVISPSKTLGAFMESFKLVESAASVIDRSMALVQAEFDPEIDLKEIKERGIRGELYNKFLQVYEASVHVNASPERLREWMFYEPYNFKEAMPSLKLQGQCMENPGILFDAKESTAYCPATYSIGTIDINSSVFSRSYEDKKAGYVNEFLIVVSNYLIRTNVQINEAYGGSELNMAVIIEIPQETTQEAIDVIIGIADVPKRIGETILDIKKGIEGTG